MSKSSDLTLDPGVLLERRAHRLAWHWGYFARRRVSIFSAEGSQVTDIDVVGIKFDETLSPSLLIIETKHESGFSSILKLKGLLDYYDSKSGFIIRPNVTPDIVKFAESLRIRAMHTSRLDEIEKELEIDSSEWSLTYSETFDKIMASSLQLLGEKGLRRWVRLRDLLWLNDDPFYKVKMVKEGLRELYAEMKDNRDSKLQSALDLFYLDLTCLFSVALVQSAGVVYTLPDHQRKPFVMDKLVSGKLSSEEKEELMGKFYGFLLQYTKSLRRPMKIRREDLKLEPAYGEILYDLLIRLSKRPASAIHLPRFFDIYMSQIIVPNKPFDATELQANLLIPRFEYEYSVKFARDILQFLFEDHIPEFGLKLIKG